MRWILMSGLALLVGMLLLGPALGFSAGPANGVLGSVGRLVSCDAVALGQVARPGSGQPAPDCSAALVRTISGSATGAAVRDVDRGWRRLTAP